MDLSFGAGGASVMDGWRRGTTCASSHHLCLRVGGHQHQQKAGVPEGSGSRLSKGGGPGTGTLPLIRPRSA